MGADYIQYIITDVVTTPPRLASLYTEKVKNILSYHIYLIKIFFLVFSLFIFHIVFLQILCHI